MLVVETIGRVRREHFVKGKSIKQIARDLRLSRNTVRKVLRSGATTFEYEREIQPRPKLGQWRSVLDDLLRTNAGKTSRERLTLIRIYETLRERGYEGGYDAVRRYARRWGKTDAASAVDAYVPLSATVPLSRAGFCRRTWNGSGASSPASMTATDRWSTFSPPC